MRSKKGVEMSLNTIIIAVIVLIVLVVLILLLTGQIGKTRIGLNRTSSEFTDKCAIPGSGRQCMSKTACQDKGGIDYGSDFQEIMCKTGGNVCCLI